MPMCFIYLFLLSSGRHKIGWTHRIENRVRSITHIDRVVRVEHAIRTRDHTWLERTLHVAFRDKRLESEWFALTPEDVSLIQSIPSPLATPDDLPRAILDLMPHLHLEIRSDADFRQAVRSIRQARGWHQSRLAEKARTDRSVICALEKGRYVSDAIKRRLADVLGLSLDAIREGKVRA